MLNYWLKEIDNWGNIKTIPTEDIESKSINIKKYIMSNEPNLINKEIAYCLLFRTTFWNINI